MIFFQLFTTLPLYHHEMFGLTEFQTGLLMTLNGLLIFLSFVINVSIGLLTLLTIPLIIFGNLSATAAIKGSITLVKKRFLVILLLLIVGFVGAFIIGIIALCIGIFFTLPFIYSLEYIIYRNAMSIEDINELDEIGSSEL